MSEPLKRPLTKIEPILYLIKFLPEVYAGKLLKLGQVYFNLPSTYNTLTSNEQGDINEGAAWIDNSEIKSIKAEHPTLGTFEFTPAPNSQSKVVQYNDSYLIYSLNAITPALFKNVDSYQIDNRMLEFNSDSAVIIEKPYVFLNSIVSELKFQKIKYEANFVTYRNLSNGKIDDINPFHKKAEHQHQIEFRIIIENINNDPKTVEIGSIEKYGRLLTSKSIIEYQWTVKRKINARDKV